MAAGTEEASLDFSKVTFPRAGWSFKPISDEPEMTMVCTSEPSSEGGWPDPPATRGGHQPLA